MGSKGVWSAGMWFIGVWFIGALGSGRWSKRDHGAVMCTGGTEEKNRKVMSQKKILVPITKQCVNHGPLI